MKQLFEDEVREFGGLDVLVNNASVYSFGPLESVTEAEFHRQYKTNVLGTLLATQEAVRLFGGKGGSIINIGTAGTRNPQAATRMCCRGWPGTLRTWSRRYSQ